MPSRDPVTGKRLSGAQNRAVRAQRERPDAPPPPKRGRKPTAAASLDPPPDAASADDIIASITALEPPPLHDTSLLITWAAKLNGAVADAIRKDPKAYPNRREWYRAIADSTTKIGIIRDKAAEQEKINKALDAEKKKERQQGLANVSGRRAPPATRPAG